MGLALDILTCLELIMPSEINNLEIAELRLEIIQTQKRLLSSQNIILQYQERELIEFIEKIKSDKSINDLQKS